MTDKEKIRTEVERLMNELIQEKEKGFGSDIDDACILELQNVLTFIESLQEELENEDLKVEIKNFLDQTGAPYYWAGEEEQLEWVEIIAQHFASWQKQKDKEQILILKDQIESCHAAMKCKEELMEIKLHKQKEEIMKDTVDAFIYKGNIRLKEWPLPEKCGKHLDSVKVIIIKEDKV